MNRKFNTAAGALILAALAMPAGAFQQRPEPPPDGIRLTHVVDGGQLRMGAAGGINIKLAGIAAPPLDQLCSDGQAREYACGQRAADFLESLIKGEAVACNSVGPQAGGMVARCSAFGRDLAGEMVRRGWAVSRPIEGADYSAFEAEARNARRGLWAGMFLPPEQWKQAGRD